jgi:hypothetical protein
VLIISGTEGTVDMEVEEDARDVRDREEVEEDNNTDFVVEVLLGLPAGFSTGVT